MAIETIVKGRDPGQAKYGGSCMGCGEIIRCVMADGNWREGDRNDQRDTGSLMVTCPTCNREIHCYPVDSPWAPKEVRIGYNKDGM